MLLVLCFVYPLLMQKRHNIGLWWNFDWLVHMILKLGSRTFINAAIMSDSCLLLAPLIWFIVIHQLSRLLLGNILTNSIHIAEKSVQHVRKLCYSFNFVIVFRKTVLAIVWCHLCCHCNFCAFTGSCFHSLQCQIKVKNMFSYFSWVAQEKNGQVF